MPEVHISSADERRLRAIIASYEVALRSISRCTSYRDALFIAGAALELVNGVPKTEQDQDWSMINDY